MKPPEGAPKDRQSPSLWPAVAILVTLHVVPFASYLLLPMGYLNTHLHEAMHALTAIATGGRAYQITVHSDGSGLTWTSGGVGLLISSAGYLGSTALGLAIVLLSRTPEAAGRVLRGLGIVLAAVLVLFVRGDLVGIVSGVFWSVLLLVAGGSLKGRARLLFTQVVGVAQVLQSLSSLSALFFVSLSPDRGSDAANLARTTGIPAVFWSVLWAALALAATGYALRHHSRKGRP